MLRNITPARKRLQEFYRSDALAQTNQINTKLAEFGNIMRGHFDLTCAKVEEVNKRFAGFDNIQAQYLYTSFSCTVPGIYLRNSCSKASK